MRSQGFARPAAAAGDARPAPVAWLYLAVIILSWACNWPLMKLALEHMPPLVFAVLRMAGSVAALTGFLAARRQPLRPLKDERRGLFWVGLAQVAGFIVFSSIGLAIVPPGRAIVLAYTMPLWAIPIGMLVAPERLAWPKIAGAVIGFGGLLLFMNPGLVDWSDARALAGNALLILAAIAWALGSCLYRRRAWASSFWSQTWWQVAGGAAAILLLAAIAERDWSVRWTPVVAAILAYNWIVTTALGYFLWSRVLALMSPAVAGQVLTLTPIGGFALSAAIFGGAMTGDVAISIGLIVAGLVLTLRSR